MLPPHLTLAVLLALATPATAFHLPTSTSRRSHKATPTKGLAAAPLSPPPLPSPEEDRLSCGGGRRAFFSRGLFAAATASALLPEPGSAAAGAAFPAGGGGAGWTLAPADLLVDEAKDLLGLVTRSPSPLEGQPVLRVVGNSLVPLQRASEKNPNNTPLGAAAAADVGVKLQKLKAAMGSDAGDAAAVAPALAQAVAAAEAYCKEMDCTQLFVAR